MNEDIRRLRNTFVNSDIYINGQYVGVIQEVNLEPGIRKKGEQWVVIRPTLHLQVNNPKESLND